MYLLHTECLEDNTETLHVTAAEQMGMFTSESGKNIDQRKHFRTLSRQRGTIMSAKQFFLRADLVYISYYALDACVADSDDTLRDVLLDRGVFSKSDSRKAGELVTSNRLW